MIRARHIYGKPIETYTSKYGPRSIQRSVGPTSVVDFSFLKPRAGLSLDELQALTPEWMEDMEYMIKHFSEGSKA